MTENNELLKLSFDIYGRYKTISDIINHNRKDKINFTVLDVGGRGNLLKNFLPIDQVYYLDPNIESKDNNFIKADGCNMPLNNNEFDWVVSADVFEHIPPVKRIIFLSEQLRVAKLGIILSAPFYSNEVHMAEISANENYRILTNGNDYPWLSEHLKNGLPSESELEEYLKKNGYDYQKTGNNNLLLWQNFIGMSFIASLNINEEISKEVEFFNIYYNKNIFPTDTNEPTYRKIYFIKKSKGLKFIHFSEGKMNNDIILEGLSKGINLIDKIIFSKNELIKKKNDEIIKLNQQIQQIYSSNLWKVANRLLDFAKKTGLIYVLKRL
jgi:O-antigen biosynthesis protein